PLSLIERKHLTCPETCHGGPQQGKYEPENFEHSYTSLPSASCQIHASVLSSLLPHNGQNSGRMYTLRLCEDLRISPLRLVKGTTLVSTVALTLTQASTPFCLCSFDSFSAVSCKQVHIALHPPHTL